MTTMMPGLLLDVTIKISLIVTLGLASAAVLRGRSAALRHWVLAAALVCAAATPLLQFVVPAWGVTPAVEPITVLATFSANGAAPATGHASPTARPAFDGRALLWVWLLGAGFSVGVLIVGFTRLAWLASRSRPVVDPRWTRVVADVAQQYGIRRPVALLQSEHPALLVTWGVLAPKVILPAAARDWSDTRIRIVIGHELAHIQRRDWVLHLAAALVRCGYWFNPLVWIACARLRGEAEQACDDAVLNLGVTGARYATELVDLARTFSTYRRSAFPLSPAPAMARPSSLERRVRAMLTAGLNRTPITRAACVATAIVLLALTLPLAGFGAPQSGPATFAGTLLDTVGRIMPDVPMTLTNVETSMKYEGRSAPNGEFAFATLPAGDYELHAEAPGFAARYRVSLKAGQQLQRPVTLQIGSLEETISIWKSMSEAPAAATAKPRQLDEPMLPARNPGPCDQSPIGGCIDQPRKLRDVKPRYPDNRNETVTVVLQARIGTDGRVKSAEGRMVAASEQDFVQSAIDAVKQWRFSTTYLDGVPVEVDMKVTAHFRVE